MFPKPLMAATITPLMLALLARGESYGYQIIQHIHSLSDGKIRWTASTLYPVLHRLETKGLITATWRESESGRKRKYYRLTAAGQQALETEKRQWLDAHALLLKVWDPTLSPV